METAKSPPSAGRFAALGRAFELPDQPRQLVVFGIEVCNRHPEDCRQPLQGFQVGLVYAGLITVDAGARNKVVEARFNAEVALRNPESLPRFAEPAAVDRQLLLVSQSRFFRKFQ